MKGGYIFEMSESGSDGGAYTLQQADRAYKVTYSGNVSYSTMPVYTDTPVQVSCKSVESLTDYLINNYTDKSKGLFDNLQSVNSALGRLSVYPKTSLTHRSRIRIARIRCWQHLHTRNCL